ncbi:MAG: CDP-diacylglycerol--serine O-phosphatidyltransferase, partial [Chitinophagaceae bacterium]|nr:CDP-diacylglycerol--serine O-phosphatidyltransferase [Chitinophagaceae bacterium]
MAARLRNRQRDIAGLRRGRAWRDCSTASGAAQARGAARTSRRRGPAAAILLGHGAGRALNCPDGAPIPSARTWPRHLPAAQPVHHRRPVRGFLRDHRRLAGRFSAACIAIFVAAILDGIDGRVARLTNTQTEFGVQYDSLADLISFGMAPALVMYHWALMSMKLDGVTLGKIGWLAAFLYAACAALRLARFNSQVGVVDKRWFIGLASPAAAGLMASFVWTSHELGYAGEELRYLALAVTVVAGLLMVSLLRYDSFKGSGSGPKADRVPFVALLIAVGVLIALWVDPPKSCWRPPCCMRCPGRRCG